MDSDASARTPVTDDETVSGLQVVVGICGGFPAARRYYSDLPAFTPLENS